MMTVQQKAHGVCCGTEFKLIINVQRTSNVSMVTIPHANKARWWYEQFQDTGSVDMKTAPQGTQEQVTNELRTYAKVV